MSEPVKMILPCPVCSVFHIDLPNPEMQWENPPHKSHLCANCGTIWRPANVETEGVAPQEIIPGTNDTWRRNF